MVYTFKDLMSFEDWFIQKLIEEKNRRINYIRKIWDSLKPKDRVHLLNYINNDFLSQFLINIIIKNYDELFIVIQERIENSFEIIKEWEKKNYNLNRS